MLFRDRLALNVSPLILRIMLAMTFIYAGSAKIQKVDFTGENAARLQALGVVGPTASTIQNEEQPTPPEPTPEEEPEEQHQEPPPQEEPVEEEPAQQQPVQAPPEDQAQQDEAPATETQPAQAPEVIRARALHYLTLMLDSAANPPPGEPALVPAWMGSGSRPVALAWVATTAELAGGALVLLGLFTRIWALALVCTMAMALWLTQIGPVVVGDAPGFYGILPALNNFDPTAWQTWLWQFSLFSAALAVFFSGAGAVSLDRLLFPKPRYGPKPPPPAKES